VRRNYHSTTTEPASEPTAVAAPVTAS
jgi:hypothetical protein